MKDARGESVSGMVITMQGANGLKVIGAVKETIASLRLPDKAKIIPFYDQSDVINATTSTVKKNLLEAAVLVVVILFLFLGDWRAALVVALTIPLSLLFGFIGMGLFGISVNLMSLGAIDFGTIVDGSVVMVENCIHRLETGRSSRPLNEIIHAASSEVARPIVFGVLIIIAVYLPILTLQSLEGRMFRPMAVTVVSALVGSLLLALFVVPSLCSLALKNRMKQHRFRTASRRSLDDERSWNARLVENLRTRYDRTLTVAFRHRKLVLASAAALVVVALVSLKFIGTEFMPTLDEGSMIVTSKRLPGISLTESVAIGKGIETIIKSFPEVQSVVTKLGRPDLATEAMGVEESDSYISFTREMQNASPERKEEFYTRLRNKLETIPGVAYEFSQPMQMRMDETITGTRGAVALKIFGTDLNTLEQLAEQAERTIAGVPGAVGTQMEHLAGAEELQVRIDRAQAARYGVNVAQVQEMIEALYGGKQVSEMITGNEHFLIALRLPDNLRNNPEDLRALEIKTATGALIRLDQIATVRSVPGPNIISREEAHRRTVVVSNVSGRDLGTFVKDARAAIDRNLPLPQGYWLEWGGQYENEVRAGQRLAIVLPVSIFIIAGLLYASFENVRQVLLILLIVPLALVGGIAALWIRGINLNLSASIGFIALFGIAVLNGIVMVSHINSLRDQGKDMEEAVREGASDRLRPVLITALVASLGFIPMALATSRGAEVERPLATVVIGGLATATLLTLYVLPLLYPLFSRTRQPSFTEVTQSV